jgi:hypothetical protein
MHAKLSDRELEILRKLLTGEAVSVSSRQRFRLELAGMLREGPRGIVLTLTGRSLARQKPPDTTASDAAPEAKVARDSRGRRMSFQRKGIS